ncbi:YceD family protein [Sphingobacterium suaedae]|uniref:YceD family protein n=1 Tax=Sphingobacterium suaedae TaxID=1686402 RepID=A0ABW5KGU2_9SPHI
MQIVKYLKQYRIPFSGLASGKHNFEFEIDNAFFDCYEHSLIKKGKLKADVELQKQENMLIVNFHIYGVIQLTCDVCLAEFEAPLDFHERALVKFTEEDWAEETEEVMVLSKTDYELDIANLLYEYVNVRVPYYSKCSEQGVNLSCDPDMLAKLSAEAPDAKTEQTEEKIDPRWDILKNIKNN